MSLTGSSLRFDAYLIHLCFSVTPTQYLDKMQLSVHFVEGVFPIWRSLARLGGIVMWLSPPIPIPHPTLWNLAQEQSDAPPWRGGQRMSRNGSRTGPCGNTSRPFLSGAWDREGHSVPRVFLFFPISLPDEVKQSLRVNRCGKNKTNIFSNWIGSFLVWVQMREKPECFD